MGYSPSRFSRYARELSQAVDGMRFRITEPVFFLHRDRIVGEVMEAPVGPYRNQAGAGGLKRFPQFVEITEKMSKLSLLANASPRPTSRSTSAPINWENAWT